MKHLLAIAALTLVSTVAGAETFVTSSGQGILSHWDTSNPTTATFNVLINKGTQGGGQPIIYIPRTIDFRPSTGVLYGMDSTGLHTINTSTGFATLVGPFGIAMDPISMDFNPQTDEIRVVGTIAGALKNVRVNPNTGAVIATDSDFTSTNNPGAPVGVTSITHVGGPTGPIRLLSLYTFGQLPFQQHTLGEVGSEAGGSASFSGGLVTNIGPTGLEQFGLFSVGGFEVSPTTGTVYLVYSIGSGGGRTNRLGSINLQTGNFSSIAQLGSAGFASNLGLSFVPPSCDGDTNGDNFVDGADLSVLLSNFGSTVVPGTFGDLNDDGVVNGADLSVLLGSFGNGC